MGNAFMNVIYPTYSQKKRNTIGCKKKIKLYKAAFKNCKPYDIIICETNNLKKTK